MSSIKRSSQCHGRDVPFRQRRGATDRCVLLAGALLVIAFCGAFFLLRFVLRDSHESGLNFKNRFVPRTEYLASNRCHDVCSTNDCIKTAAIALDLMDPTLDPCEDFYSYACAGYKKASVNFGKRQLFLKELDDFTTNLLQDMISEIPKSLPENTTGYSVAKLRNFYDSCVDIGTSEANAVETALQYLERFGVRNWPKLDDDYNFGHPDIYEVLVRLYLYGEQPLFHLDFSHLPSTERSKSEDLEDEMILLKFTRYQMFHHGGKVDKETMILLKAVLAYFIQDDTVASETLKDVLEFDMGLCNITEKAVRSHELCKENDRDICSPYMYNCAQGGNPHVDRWCKITSEIMQRSGFPKLHTAIRLEDREYFLEIDQFLRSAKQKTIAHALALYFLKENALYMNFGLRKEAKFPHFQDLPPQFYNETVENRSPFCAIWASFRLPMLSGFAYYSEKYNNSELRKQANRMFSDIKEFSIAAVKDMEWPDAGAKASLVELFSKITFDAENYLPYMGSGAEIDELLKEFEITDESFLANELEAHKIKAILTIRYMDNPTKAKTLLMDPFKFMPTFNPETRTVTYYIGILVFPFLSSERPWYANLGYIGFTMGHELGHPVESLFRNYENKSESFANALEERWKCMEERIPEFEIELNGEKVKGKLRLDETIADFLGIRAAYKSLKKHHENHGTEQMLPGFNFTNEQSFFIIATQFWCEVNSLQFYSSYLRGDPGTAITRILGIYQNFDAFSEAFNCPVGSPMNPVEKCNFE